MSDDLKIRMTIDEAIAFAHEWSRGMTLHAGSQGWRVVCMLLADEVERQRAAVAALIAERDAAMAIVHDEIAANHAFREAGGARPDEDMPTFCARLIAEREERADTIDDLKADIDKLTDANTEALEHMAEIRAERDALRADAERYRWLRDSGKFAPSLGSGAWGLALGIWSASAEMLDRAVDNDRARGGAE